MLVGPSKSNCRHTAPGNWLGRQTPASDDTHQTCAIIYSNLCLSSCSSGGVVNALDSGSNLFGGAGSNPVLGIALLLPYLTSAYFRRCIARVTHPANPTALLYPSSTHVTCRVSTSYYASFTLQLCPATPPEASPSGGCRRARSAGAQAACRPAPLSSFSCSDGGIRGPGLSFGHQRRAAGVPLHGGHPSSTCQALGRASLKLSLH